MKLWCVSMMRDEADVAVDTVEHLLAQGVDGVVVADNMSTDGTGDLLRELGSQVHVVDDTDPAYTQSAKMTRLAAMAADLAGDGPLWIVPFDADELWVPADRSRTVSDVVRECTDVDVVAATVYNHYRTALDDESEPSPFRRLEWRDSVPLGLPKVACRWRPDLVIAQGNHAASYSKPAGGCVSGVLEVHHYPYRSRGQVLRKIRNGAAAYAASNLPREMGLHWRELGVTLDSVDGEAKIDSHMAAWFFFDDPEGSAMVRDPVL